MKNEFVMLPREWAESVVAAGPGETVCRTDLDILRAAIAEQHRVGPVALAAERLEVATGEMSDIYQKVLQDSERYQVLRQRLAVEDFPAEHPDWSAPSESESVRIDELCDAALSASAEPSAPVERDELKPCPFCGCQVTFLTGREDYRIAGKHGRTCPFVDVDVVVDGWEAWQNRASLERKP